MFKKCFVLILLTVLAVRPAFYVGNVMYYQTHINEIVEKYCVNKDKPQLQCKGKCHLAKQINASSSSDNTEAVTDISTAFYPVFYQEIKPIIIRVDAVSSLTTHFKESPKYAYLSTAYIHKPPIV